MATDSQNITKVGKALCRTGYMHQTLHITGYHGRERPEELDSEEPRTGL